MSELNPPSQKTLKNGLPEDVWTGRLAAALRKKGFNAEGPSPIFHINIGGKQRIRKPDFAVYNETIHIGSAKLGSKKEIDSIVSAQEYSQQLSTAKELNGKELGEIFAVTYPGPGERNFILHILARTGLHDEIPRITDSFEELIEDISKALRGEFSEVLLRAEPTINEAKRLLRNGAFNLSDTLEGVKQEELERVFGGHDFFGSVIATKLSPVESLRILKLGAAFLFINQILFYSLLSRESEKRSDNRYPPIEQDHQDSPDLLQEYFERVLIQNYDPIYGIKISQIFQGKKSRLACKAVVTAINSLVPKLDSSDLAGQVFQTLIPIEIRKPLGAHFTNPNAATLLAQSVITDSDSTVLDPACGSGTLLVAAYRTKMALSNGDQAKLHKKFVEKHITGIDAMAFSSHLAAVNLALQMPLNETNHVRIGTTDSTSLKPGSEIQVIGERLPSEFRQVSLGTKPVQGKRTQKKRVVSLKGKAQAFKINRVDTVLMNPPFTSWDNMDKIYRDNLKRRFSVRAVYKRLIFFKPSQQLFFLFLTDMLLKKDGRVAAVLPLTTLTAKSFHLYLNFMLNNYTVEAIFVGLGRSAYSEDTSLTECLFIAKKCKPDTNNKFMLLGTKKDPNDWKYEEIRKLINQVKRKNEGSDEFSIRKAFLQKELLPENKTLSSLYLSLIEEYDQGLVEFENLLKRSIIPLVNFGHLTASKGIEATQCVFSGKHFHTYGPKAVIATRSKKRSIRKATDRLYFDHETRSKVVLRDRVTDKTYSISKKNIKPAIRRFSYLRTIDNTNESDLCITKITNEVEEIISDLYGKRESKNIIRRLRREWGKMVSRGSSRLSMMWRVNWGAKGTTLISVRNDQPAFLVIKGKYFTGISDPIHEKLLCMWFNSSAFILFSLGQARITEGAYMDLEEYTLDKSPVPDISKLTPIQRTLIDELWSDIRHIEVPSLLEQLENNHPFRAKLDDGILKLLGIKDKKERNRLATIFRKGAYITIRTLQETMNA